MSRNASSVALQSLTATYTDSEGEEDDHRFRKRSNSPGHEDEDGDIKTTDLEKDSQVLTSTNSPESNKSGTNTPQSGSSVCAAEIRRVAARLVSYNNDEAMSDEDESDNEDSNSRVAFPIKPSRAASPEILILPGEELLPPEPPGKCPSELQDKISRLYDKMTKEGINMNFSIQQRKQFRNPSLYEKLIDHLDIEELGTNYPESLYNPKQWSEESYYESLAKVQREEMERREKEKRERTKVEFVSGTATKKSTTDSEDKKRKSKWDQTHPSSLANSAAAATAAAAAAVLTNMPTGTKTAIPAFGTLPKKTKIT